MNLKKILIVIIIISFTGCKRYYYHPDCGYRPKRPRFKLAKQKFVYSNLIDTAAVYKWDADDKYNFYIKFYGNGRITEFIKEKNKALTKSDLKRGSIGYYQLTGNQIATEIFVVNDSQWSSSYVLTNETFVKGDTIFESYKSEFHRVYIKEKINFKAPQSDW